MKVEDTQNLKRTEASMMRERESYVASFNFLFYYKYILDLICVMNSTYIIIFVWTM